MAVYVFVGGMVATTWVQVIKSSILAILAAVIALGVLAKFGFSSLSCSRRPPSTPWRATRSSPRA